MFRADFRCFLPLALAFIIAIAISERVDSAKSKAESERDRLIRQVKRPPVRPEQNVRFEIFPPENEPIPIGASRSGDRVGNLGHSSNNSTAGTPPPPSPGRVIGSTYYDMQSLLSQGHQVGRSAGADIVHFSWMYLNAYEHPEPNRYVSYAAYRISDDSVLQGYGGQFIGLGVLASAGYPNIATGQGNAARIALHQREEPALPYRPWILSLPISGNSLHIDEQMSVPSECPEYLWPKVAVDPKTDDTDIVHLIGHSNINDCLPNQLIYWRYDGWTWQGPTLIDTVGSVGYVIAADQNSPKVAIVTHSLSEPGTDGRNNIICFESESNGSGWLDGTELNFPSRHAITSYSGTSGPQAWHHISAAYDNSSVLHVVWDEQRYADSTNEVAIHHWNNNRQTIRPVALGYWPSPQLTGVYNLNLSKLSLGVGDGGTVCSQSVGTNQDYLYVLYTRFSGPTAEEQADFSWSSNGVTGYYNGELYLNVSADNGASWSVPQNLTNTKTPHCHPGAEDTIAGIPNDPDSVCRSEHWATIGQNVSDIDVFYIGDLDAGAAVRGEGIWTHNPVIYLRIPGGTPDAEYLCPEFAPNMALTMSSTIECEYHAAPGEIKSDETLTIMNIGNATLSGSISVIDAPWLTVVGGGGFALPPGSNDLVLPLTMNATSLGEGLYSGTIRITHNDSAQPNPYDIPIDFFVIADFNCTQGAVISTGVE